MWNKIIVEIVGSRTLGILQAPPTSAHVNPIDFQRMEIGAQLLLRGMSAWHDECTYNWAVVGWCCDAKAQLSTASTCHYICISLESSFLNSAQVWGWLFEIKPFSQTKMTLEQGNLFGHARKSTMAIEENQVCSFWGAVWIMELIFIAPIGDCKLLCVASFSWAYVGLPLCQW